jgi:hypothetical protein
VAALPPPDPKRESGDPQQADQDERRRQLLRLLAEIEKRVNEVPMKMISCPSHSLVCVAPCSKDA